MNKKDATVKSETEVAKKVTPKANSKKPVSAAVKVEKADVVGLTLKQTFKQTLKQAEKIDGPVVLNVSYNKDLALEKRLERAAHKRGVTAKGTTKSGIHTMVFTFHRKAATTNAITRMHDRFGSNVVLSVAGAVA